MPRTFFPSKCWIAVATLALCPLTASAALLTQTAPGSVSYSAGVDFGTLLWSGIGDVTASVQAVDLQLGLGNSSTSGCEAADFAGFAAGSIALLQRGTCTFEQKAENAWAAGAVGALVFNQGNTSDPERTGLFSGTLNQTFDLQDEMFPVMSLTYALGVEFAVTPSLTLRMVITADDPIRPAPVPEPTSLALAGLGLAAVAAARRRRRRKH